MLDSCGENVDRKLHVEKYKILLLDGTNFGNWKFRMETLLNELELLESVREPYNTIEYKSSELEVTSLVKGKKMQITIKDVLIVPGLEHNLLSVRKLEGNGYRVVFENGMRSFDKNGRVTAVAELNERQLYVLKLYANEETILMSESVEVWHKRLGYLNYKSLKRLPPQVRGMNISKKAKPVSVCRV